MGLAPGDGMAGMAAVHVSADHPNPSLLLSVDMGDRVYRLTHVSVVVDSCTTNDCPKPRGSRPAIRSIEVHHVACDGIFALAKRRSLARHSCAAMAPLRGIHRQICFDVLASSVFIYRVGEGRSDRHRSGTAYEQARL